MLLHRINFGKVQRVYLLGEDEEAPNSRSETIVTDYGFSAAASQHKWEDINFR